VVNCGRIDLTCELVSYWKLDDGQGVTAVLVYAWTWLKPDKGPVAV
jgi:hypothetical protein